MADIAGFWSYVHADNDSVGDAIVKLAKRVTGEFELLSGGRLRLFVDRDLEWGDEWSKRIDRELQETTFFIPIITPRYFQSEECRRELVKFKSAADRFGVNELLLPLYYVTVPEMEEEEPQDELMALVKSIQREDMREVRLAEEWDSTHRKLVNRLATRLLKISRETEGLSVPPDEPAVEPAGMASPGLDGSSADQKSTSSNHPVGVAEPKARESTPTVDERGSLEVLAEGEEALEKWGGSIQDLNKEIKNVGMIVEASSESMSAAENFAKTLAVANRLARDLEAPADNFIAIGQEYSTHLITVDPAVQTLIEEVRTDIEAKEQAEAKEVFGAILEMVQVSRASGEQIKALISAMEGPAGASRELRQPLRKMQTALRNFVDGQKILDDWEMQIREVYGDSLSENEQEG